MKLSSKYYITQITNNIIKATDTKNPTSNSTYFDLNGNRITNEKYDKYISACKILDIDPKDVEQTEQNEAYGSIKNKYRRLALIYHPDKNKGDVLPENYFENIINQAQ